MILDESVLEVYYNGNYASKLYYGSDLIWEEGIKSEDPLIESINKNGLKGKNLSCFSKGNKDIYYDNTTRKFIVCGWGGLCTIDEDTMEINKISVKNTDFCCGASGKIVASSGSYVYLYENGELIKEMRMGEVIYRIKYLNGTYIATGKNGNIFTSTDGKNWNKIKINPKKSLLDASYGNGIYVVVGYDHTFAFSKDLISWNFIYIRHNGAACKIENIDYNDVTNEFFITTNEFRAESRDRCYAIDADTLYDEDYSYKIMSFGIGNDFKHYHDLRTNGKITIATCNHHSGNQYNKVTMSLDNGKNVTEEIEYGRNLYETKMAIGRNRIISLYAGKGYVKYTLL